MNDMTQIAQGVALNTQTPVVLEAKNLNFYYGATQALWNIKLPMLRNSVTALIGPSGCGKSTFLRTLNRIYGLYPGHRAEGEVIFDGVDILNTRVDMTVLRSRIGMVFQKPNPFPMTIYENIAFGVRLYHKKSKREMDEIVERALRQGALWDEVKDKLHSPGSGLSGGQQQRLCIARAVAVDPEVILMDEPCSALDPIATAKIEELIDELRTKFAIVIVTHNMQQAARVSQKTAFFHLGHLVEYGDTPDIFTNPREARTKDYITGRYG